MLEKRDGEGGKQEEKGRSSVNKEKRQSTYGTRGVRDADGGIPVVSESGFLVLEERMFEMEEYRGLEEEGGGAVRKDLIENGKTDINRVRHTPYPAGVSVCACPRGARGKGKKYAGSGGPGRNGSYCPFRTTLPSRRYQHRPARRRSP